MDESVLNCLIQLVELDLACAASYETAASVCQEEEIKGKLIEFKNDHDRHVRDLSEFVTKAEQQAPSDLDAKGVVIKGFTMLSAQEDRSAVLAMRGNEELSNSAYASALKADLPNDVRELILTNFEDERRHMAWLRETVISRGWEVEPPEIREAAAEFQRLAA